jgi:hypothetical protein
LDLRIKIEDRGWDREWESGSRIKIKIENKFGIAKSRTGIRVEDRKPDRDRGMGIGIKD